MHKIIRLFAVAALAVGLTAPAIAQTDEQRAALEQTIADFGVATQANDVAGMMSAVPPKVLDQVVAQVSAASGQELTREMVIAATQQMVTAAMATMTFVSFNMDVGAAEFTTSADGLLYALIPTESVIDIEGAGKMKSANTTLALYEDDTWYLVRVDDAQQVGILKQIYPTFADVTFPVGTMETVTE